MCTRKLISEKNFSNLSTFALNVSIKTLLIAHIFFNKSEIFSGFKPKKKKNRKKKSIGCLNRWLERRWSLEWIRMKI